MAAIHGLREGLSPPRRVAADGQAPEKGAHGRVQAGFTGDSKLEDSAGAQKGAAWSEFSGSTAASLPPPQRFELGVGAAPPVTSLASLPDGAYELPTPCAFLSGSPSVHPGGGTSGRSFRVEKHGDGLSIGWRGKSWPITPDEKGHFSLAESIAGDPRWGGGGFAAGLEGTLRRHGPVLELEVREYNPYREFAQLRGAISLDGGALPATQSLPVSLAVESSRGSSVETLAAQVELVASEAGQLTIRLPPELTGGRGVLSLPVLEGGAVALEARNLKVSGKVQEGQVQLQVDSLVHSRVTHRCTGAF